MKAPKDILRIEIMLLHDEKQVLKECLEKLYKDKKLTLLTINSMQRIN